MAILWWLFGTQVRINSKNNGPVAHLVERRPCIITWKAEASGSNAGFKFMNPLESPDGSIYHVTKTKQKTNNLRRWLQNFIVIYLNDSSSLMYFSDGLVDINETVYRLNPTLLGGWLGSNADEGCGKLQNALARRMQSLNQRCPNETSHLLRKERERRELKRLSTCRKRNQLRCC